MKTERNHPRHASVVAPNPSLRTDGGVRHELSVHPGRRHDLQPGPHPVQLRGPRRTADPRAPRRRPGARPLHLGVQGRRCQGLRRRRHLARAGELRAAARRHAPAAGADPQRPPVRRRLRRGPHRCRRRAGRTPAVRVGRRRPLPVPGRDHRGRQRWPAAAGPQSERGLGADLRRDRSRPDHRADELQRAPLGHRPHRQSLSQRQRRADPPPDPARRESHPQRRRSVQLWPRGHRGPCDRPSRRPRGRSAAGPARHDVGAGARHQQLSAGSGTRREHGDGRGDHLQQRPHDVRRRQLRLGRQHRAGGPGHLHERGLRPVHPDPGRQRRRVGQHVAHQHHQQRQPNPA